ncbi:MAG TPA: hypothetical protein VI197_24530 [Polyangiaceae bacterium]
MATEVLSVVMFFLQTLELPREPFMRTMTMTIAAGVPTDPRDAGSKNINDNEYLRMWVMWPHTAAAAVTMVATMGQRSYASS